jgi:cell division transport system permease protein
MGLNTLSYYWREALFSIIRNSWLSAASVGTVAVSLFIVGIFSLLVVNTNELTGGIESSLEIRVYLKENQSRESINKIRGEIEGLPGVSMIDFISRDQALEDMKKSFGDRSDVLEGLQNDNPLPDTFKIRAADAEQIPGLAGSIERIEGVDQVMFGRGVVEKLVAATRWLRLAGLFVLAVLSIAAVFLISTTIRMSVFARRKEIGIMILLGATNWFVRFPYLLEGMMLGFLGGVLAGLAVYTGYISLTYHISQTLPFIHLVTDRQTIMSVMGGILGVGLVIGALGSSFSIRKFLKI